MMVWRFDNHGVGVKQHLLAGNDGVEASDSEAAAHSAHPLVDAVHIVAHRAG